MKGFFFGSFDPPHIGHVNVITAALNYGNIDKVEVVPAYKNVWKDTKTPYHSRKLMCHLTFSNIPNVIVNNIEQYLTEEEPVPTYKVIDFLREHEKEDFVIITTNETYQSIPKWEEGNKILKENKFLVVYSSHFKDFDTNVENTIFMPDIDICSTVIRQNVKEGKLIQPFVNKEVIDFINKRKLYK